MRLFLKAHRGPHIAAGVLVLTLASCWLAGRSLPLPQLLEGRAEPVAVQLLLSTGVAPLVVYGFAGPTLQLESLARRRLLGPDAALAALVVVPLATVTAGAAALGDSRTALTSLRDIAAFTGLSLVILVGGGATAAATAPVAYFLVMATLGGGSGSGAQWWAPFREPVNGGSLVTAVVLLAAGLTAFHAKARRRTTTRPAPGNT